MVFGMLPIALGASAGAEWKSGLAWALIGGLTSSLLLTLILVPVVYVKVDQMRESVPAFFAGILRKRKWNFRPGGSAEGMPAMEFQEGE
jgi:HAE1 family hydrophobic/amphiphilic exporter-1